MNLSLETVLRCLDLVPIVRENPGITLGELARRTGFKESLIVDQLIPTLMLCGAPPYMPHDYVSIWMEGDEVHCSFADHFRRPVTLLPIEITALHLALSSSWFPGGRDGAVETRIAKLREKIENALPPEQRIFLRESERISIRDRLDADSPLLDALQGAIARRRKVRLDYLSGGETRSAPRIIRPHGILVQNGVTYVPSYDEKRGHMVPFRLDRMRAAEVLDESFAVETDFSLERLVEEGLFKSRARDEVEVVIQATGSAARRIAEGLDQSQWRWESDGDVLVLRLPTSRPRAVVRYLFSLGPEAVIVGPAEVRAIVREELEAAKASL